MTRVCDDVFVSGRCFSGETKRLKRVTMQWWEHKPLRRKRWEILDFKRKKPSSTLPRDSHGRTIKKFSSHPSVTPRTTQQWFNDVQKSPTKLFWACELVSEALKCKQLQCCWLFSPEVTLRKTSLHTGRTLLLITWLMAAIISCEAFSVVEYSTEL